MKNGLVGVQAKGTADGLKSRPFVGSSPTETTDCDGTRRAGCPVLPDKQNGQIRFLVVLLAYSGIV